MSETKQHRYGIRVQPPTATNINDILRSALKSRGYTIKMIADELGYSSVGSIGNALGGRNIRIDIIARMLDALGYDIIVKDRNGNNRENVWKVETRPREE